jgi:hypothetical protein
LFPVLGRMVCDEDRTPRLLVDEIGADDGLVVEVGSGSTWTAVDEADLEQWPLNALAQWQPVEALARLDTSWPDGPRQRVRITARWGWPAVPDEVIEATLLLAARLYKRKSSPDGTAGVGEWGPVRVSATDPDVFRLIHNLLLPGAG